MIATAAQHCGANLPDCTEDWRSLTSGHRDACDENLPCHDEAKLPADLEPGLQSHGVAVNV